MKPGDFIFLSYKSDPNLGWYIIEVLQPMKNQYFVDGMFPYAIHISKALHSDKIEYHSDDDGGMISDEALKSWDQPPWQARLISL